MYRACPREVLGLRSCLRILRNPGTSSTSVQLWAAPSPGKGTRQAPPRTTECEEWEGVCKLPAGDPALRPETPLWALHSFPRNLHSPAEPHKGPGVLRNSALSQGRKQGHVPPPHPRLQGPDSGQPVAGSAAPAPSSEEQRGLLVGTGVAPPALTGWPGFRAPRSWGAAGPGAEQRGTRARSAGPITWVTWRSRPRARTPGISRVVTSRQTPRPVFGRRCPRC